MFYFEGFSVLFWGIVHFLKLEKLEFKENRGKWAIKWSINLIIFQLLYSGIGMGYCTFFRKFISLLYESSFIPRIM